MVHNQKLCITYIIGRLHTELEAYSFPSTRSISFQFVLNVTLNAAVEACRQLAQTTRWPSCIVAAVAELFCIQTVIQVSVTGMWHCPCVSHKRNASSHLMSAPVPNLFFFNDHYVFW